MKAELKKHLKDVFDLEYDLSFEPFTDDYKEAVINLFATVRQMSESEFNMLKKMINRKGGAE
jgi:hypothetical protein